jgi:adenosylhomocysteine nucleosidase
VTDRSRLTRLALISALHDELAALLPGSKGLACNAWPGATSTSGVWQATMPCWCSAASARWPRRPPLRWSIDRLGARRVLFTGVAGGLRAGVGVGDVVVADALLQHDLDASPLFPRWEVPLTGRSRFATDPALTQRLTQAADRVLAAPHPARAAFGLRAAQRHVGLVVSGDRFVSSAAESSRLRADLPDALAVEMEGAALAQVCADFDCPLGVLRTVSDRADDSAHVDFPRFLREVAAECSRDIVLAALGTAYS